MSGLKSCRRLILIIMIITLLLIYSGCSDAVSRQNKASGQKFNAESNGEYMSKSSIEICEIHAQISAGEEMRCELNIFPSDAVVELVWESSNENIASVENGLITAYQGGTATITVRDKISGKSDEISITVKNDYLEKTRAAIEYLAVSYTDTNAAANVKHQQKILNRCTDPDAQEVRDALNKYMKFADAGGKCDLQKISDVLGVNENTLRMAAECIHFGDQMSDDSVTFSFTGDCTFAYRNEEKTKDSFHSAYKASGSVTYPFDRVKHIFELDDVTVINYEATLADPVQKKPEKNIYFRGEPEYVNILTGSSVEVANQANNHSMDYLEVGRARTEQLLTEAGVAVVNVETPVIMQVNGIEVVIISAGHNYYPTKIDEAVEAMHEQINKYQREDNIVAVVLHWGAEYSTYPTRKQINEAHKMIDEGADIIVCHHAHILQGIEIYKGKVIAHGLGNFAYSGITTLKENETFILRATFSKEDGMVKMREWSVVPCYVSSTGTLKNNYQPMTVYGKNAKNVMRLLIERSERINGCETIPYFYYE